MTRRHVYTSLAERIEQLVRKYGSRRKAAKAIGVSETHLRGVAHGDRHISPELVQKLGLIAETKYRVWGS